MVRPTFSLVTGRFSRSTLTPASSARRRFISLAMSMGRSSSPTRTVSTMISSTAPASVVARSAAIALCRSRKATMIRSRSSSLRASDNNGRPI